MAKSDKKIIIYCEGKTEPDYFKEFKTRDEDNFDYIAIEGDGGSRQEIVDNAFDKWDAKVNSEINRITKGQRKPKDKAKREVTQAMERKYERWLVMDHDGDGRRKGEKPEDDFQSAIEDARNKGFNVAYSNMCFEYWVLLHFESDFSEGKSIPLPIKTGDKEKDKARHSRNSIREVNKKIKPLEYDKANVSEIFDLLLAFDPTHTSSAYPKGMRRIVLAYQRAKKLHYQKEGFSVAPNMEEYPDESQEEISTIWDESITLVYKLLNRIGIIVEVPYMKLDNEPTRVFGYKGKYYILNKIDDEGTCKYEYEEIEQVSDLFYEPVYYKDIDRRIPLIGKNYIKKK